MINSITREQYDRREWKRIMQMQKEQQDPMDMEMICLLTMNGVTAEVIEEHIPEDHEVLWPGHDANRLSCTTLDPMIFGPYDEPRYQDMGFITLPFPVVNIRFTTGEHPEIYDAIDWTSKEDLDGLIHERKLAIFKKENRRWKCQEVLSREIYESYHYTAIREKVEEDPNYKILFGGDAIAQMITDKSMRDMIMLTKIPVAPLGYRFYADKPINDLQYVYDQLMEEVVHYKMLQGHFFYEHFEVEDDIGEINYEQEARSRIKSLVDCLIDNGGDGNIMVDHYGMPLETLDEMLYDYIGIPRKEMRERYSHSVDIKQLQRAVRHLKHAIPDDYSCAFSGEEAENVVQLLQPLIEAIGKTDFGESWKTHKEALITCCTDGLYSSFNKNMKELGMNDILSGFSCIIHSNMEFYERKMIERRQLGLN